MGWRRRQALCRRTGHLGSHYRGPDLASANAVFIMLYALGMLGGPPIVGFGVDLAPPDGFFFSIAALLTLYLGLVLRAPRGAQG
jgi:hypothetical protein